MASEKYFFVEKIRETSTTTKKIKKRRGIHFLIEKKLNLAKH